MELLNDLFAMRIKLIDCMKDGDNTLIYRNMIQSIEHLITAIREENE